MKPSVIQNSFGYVVKFDEQHQIVFISEDIHDAMVFYSVEEVEEFIDQHADCGHGLRSDDYTLVELVDVDSH